MKKCLLLVVASLILFPALAQSQIDILHYKYELELSDKNDSIRGQAHVTVKFLADTRQLTLDLVSNSGGKGMTVFTATEYENTNRPLTFQHSNNRLTLNLNSTARSGDTRSFIIRYAGIPQDGLIISKNKFGKRTFFSDNWPNRAQHWIPCADVPSDKATVEFLVTAPVQYKVISNGILVEESNLTDNKKLTHWKETVPLPTKVMVIGVAEFAVEFAGNVNNCIPVHTWVYPENKKDGFYDFGIATEILEYFIRYIGPYPYAKLANVQSKTRFGGMENAGAIFYSESSVSGKRKEERLIAHEIVHQWFGNMATEKHFAHLWLSEGFATYLTHVYLESKYGTDSMNNRLKDDRSTIITFVNKNRKPVVDSSSSYMDLLNANSYQKGGWVLHMLRRQLGDSIFHQAVRNYYALYAGKNAGTADLQKVFEQVSGTDLKGFFHQWLYVPENPKLQVDWNHSPSKGEIRLDIRQMQQRPFRFPLEVALVFPDKSVEVKKINIKDAAEIFVFPSTQKPSKVILDPNTSLLFEGTVKTGR